MDPLVLHLRRRAGPGAPAIALAALLAVPVWAVAADGLSGIGNAFRPQVLPPAAAAAAASSADAAGGATTGLRVVVKGANRAVASIDGRLVRVGDVVNGMRVMHISDQGVSLKGEDGAMERLSLNPSAVKKTLPAMAPRATEGARR